VEDLIRQAKRYSKGSIARLTGFADAVRMIDDNKIEGDIVECGVWAGGHIILARKLSPMRMCWLYDTFAGMTRPGQYDVKKNGATALERWLKGDAKWIGIPVDQVKKNMAETGTLDEAKLRFIEGPVEQTLIKPENLPDRIALLRLDTDWHDSTKIELEVLFPRLSSGGVLIVDDYGHWLGARKAVDDYFGKRAWDQLDYTAVQMVKSC